MLLPLLSSFPQTKVWKDLWVCTTFDMLFGCNLLETYFERTATFTSHPVWSFEVDQPKQGLGFGMCGSNVVAYQMPGNIQPRDSWPQFALGIFSKQLGISTWITQFSRCDKISYFYYWVVISVDNRGNLLSMYWYPFNISLLLVIVHNEDDFRPFFDTAVFQITPWEINI